MSTATTSSQRERVVLSAAGEQHTADFSSLLEDSVITGIKTSIKERNRGKAVDLKTFPKQEVQAAADELVKTFELEFPEARKTIKTLLNEKVTAWHGETLVSVPFIKALFDEKLRIPESEDGSGASNWQIIMAKWAKAIIDPAFANVYKEKKRELKNALPDSPLKPKEPQVFGSRVGWTAKVIINVFSGISAAPNYLFFTKKIGQLLPGLPAELTVATSIYLAASLSRAVNFFDRRYVESVGQEEKNIRGLKVMLTDKKHLGDRAVNMVIAKKVFVPVIDPIARGALRAYDQIASKITKGKHKPKDRGSFTVNPEITRGADNKKKLLGAALSFFTTLYGGVEIVRTQDSVNESIDKATNTIVTQRGNEFSTWTGAITEPSANPGEKPSMRDYLDAWEKTEAEGGSVVIGGKTIENRTKGGKGLAWEGKKGLSIQTIENFKAKAEHVRKEYEAQIAREMTVLKGLAYGLDEDKLEELINRYYGPLTANSAKNEIKELELYANELLTNYKKKAGELVEESRRAYGIIRNDEVIETDIDFDSPEFKALEDVDIEIHRQDLMEALEETKKAKGTLGLILLLIQATLLVIAIEKTSYLLLPNIAGKLRHGIKSALGNKSQYSHPVVPGSEGQQLQIGLLGTNFPGFLEETKRTNQEDRSGTIQENLDAQQEHLAVLYAKWLSGLNKEFSMLIPGFTGFTQETITTKLAEYVENRIKDPKLAEKLREGLMSPGAKHRRRQYRTQKALILSRETWLRAGLARILKAGSFNEFLETIFPRRAINLVLNRTIKGEIYDLVEGLELALLICRKTGSDDIAYNEIKKITDWRGAETIRNQYTAMADHVIEQHDDFYEGPANPDVEGYESQKEMNGSNTSADSDPETLPRPDTHAEPSQPAKSWNEQDPNSPSEQQPASSDATWESDQVSSAEKPQGNEPSRPGLFTRMNEVFREAGETMVAAGYGAANRVADAIKSRNGGENEEPSRTPPERKRAASVPDFEDTQENQENARLVELIEFIEQSLKDPNPNLVVLAEAYDELTKEGGLFGEGSDYNDPRTQSLLEFLTKTNPSKWGSTPEKADQKIGIILKAGLDFIIEKEQGDTKQGTSSTIQPEPNKKNDSVQEKTIEPIDIGSASPEQGYGAPFKDILASVEIDKKTGSLARNVLFAFDSNNDELTSQFPGILKLHKVYETTLHGYPYLHLDFIDQNGGKGNTHVSRITHVTVHGWAPPEANEDQNTA